ncbi:exonuclease family protein [Babesia divergens]|uniref:Exonuclease family protein n=1 Tax=Babesia divergens TaxID=32595 RepID=A0AAD9LFB0_BABDI|nr:exonuclease family protein [Babesia divergens]
MNTNAKEKEAFTLQPILRQRSAAIDWPQLQHFITWLICHPSRVKCPLELRQGRSRAHSNVIVAVPYLDSDYMMVDVEPLLSLLNSGTSGSLFRIKSPYVNVENGACNIMKKLLFMDGLEEVTSDEREHRCIANSLVCQDEMRYQGYPSTQDFGDLCESPSEITATLSSDTSKDVILDTLHSNLSANRCLCKSVEDLQGAFERYRKTAFTTALSIAPSADTADGKNNGATIPDDNEFRFTGELIEKYADYVDHLKSDQGFVKLLAMDCEMVSTSEGTELARITIVDPLFNVVVDSLVKPTNPITNYRTVYSGITAECLEDVTVSLADVKAFLARIIDSETILIGHSVNYDLSLHTVQTKMQLGLDLKRQHGHDSYSDSAVTMYLAVAGIIELNLFTKRDVNVLGRSAFRALTNSNDTFPNPRIYLFDQMIHHYDDVLDETIIGEHTDDDEASVQALVDRVRSNYGTNGPGVYILVLRDFQVNCIQSLFQETPNQKCLTKRLGQKTVSSFLMKLAGIIDRIATCLEDNDILILSNLIGNIAQANILWRTLNGSKVHKSNALMKLLWRVYKMAHGDEVDEASKADSSENVPECVSHLHMKSQQLTISLLRREYEVATRENGLNWAVFLSKQVSRKRPTCNIETQCAN